MAWVSDGYHVDFDKSKFVPVSQPGRHSIFCSFFPLFPFLNFSLS